MENYNETVPPEPDKNEMSLVLRRSMVLSHPIREVYLTMIGHLASIETEIENRRFSFAEHMAMIVIKGGHFFTIKDIGPSDSEGCNVEMYFGSDQIATLHNTDASRIKDIVSTQLGNNPKAMSA